MLAQSKCRVKGEGGTNLDSDSSDLRFRRTSRRKFAPRVDQCLEILIINHDALGLEDLGHSVVRKHCKSMNVTKVPQARAAIGAPNVADKDLGTLIKENLETRVDCMVSESWKRLSDAPHQILSASPSLPYHVGSVPAVPGFEARADLP